MPGQVRDVHWSNTGDSFICINGSNQPQLYDRDGSQIAEYIKGDMYIRDLRHCAYVASSSIANRPPLISARAIQGSHCRDLLGSMAPQRPFDIHHRFW